MERARSVRWAAAAALALAAVGCTTPHHDRALPAPSASAACTDPRYEFTPAVRTEVLTYVTPVVTLTAPEGGPVRFDRPLAVRQLTATASSSAGEADARRAYETFVRQSGNVNMPAFGGAPEPYPGSAVVSIGRAGRFAAFAFDYVVTSTFVRHCGGAGAGQFDAVGSVSTLWPRFALDSVIDCAAPRRADQEQAAQQAVQLVCGTSS